MPGTSTLNRGTPNLTRIVTLAAVTGGCLLAWHFLFDRSFIAWFGTAVLIMFWVYASVFVLGGTSSVRSLFPYGNRSALAAYYCGIVSLIPILGIPFAIAAIHLGRRGLRNCRFDPQGQGKLHARCGIVLAGFSFLFLIAVVLVVGLSR